MLHCHLLSMSFYLALRNPLYLSFNLAFILNEFNSFNMFLLIIPSNFVQIYRINAFIHFVWILLHLFFFICNSIFVDYVCVGMIFLSYFLYFALVFQTSFYFFVFEYSWIPLREITPILQKCNLFDCLLVVSGVTLQRPLFGYPQ